MKKRLLSLLTLVILSTTLLTGCVESNEAVLYNKLITGGIYKEIKDEQSGKTLNSYLIINHDDKELKLLINDYDTVNSLKRYVKYKSNTEPNASIELNVIYNADKEAVVGISPIINNK